MSPLQEVVAAGRAVDDARVAKWRLLKSNAPGEVTLIAFLSAPRSVLFRLRVAFIDWRIRLAEDKSARAWERFIK